MEERQRIVTVMPATLRANLSEMIQKENVTYYARVSTDMNELELYHGLAEHIPTGLHARNIRSVVTIHNMEFLYDNTFTNSPSHLAHRIYMTHMLHRVDRIVAVSECVKLCNQRLDSAKQKIEMLTVNADGEQVVKPFGEMQDEN